MLRGLTLPCEKRQPFANTAWFTSYDMLIKSQQLIELSFILQSQKIICSKLL